MHERCRDIRVICFDVDGTLVEHPQDKTVWQILNRRYLDGDAVNGRRFADFKEGRISYPRWVELDIGDWQARGILRDQIESAIAADLSAVEGARATVQTLSERGYRVAVISGTIDVTLDKLLPGLPFDRVYSNRIFFNDDGTIRGWQATPYDVWGKPEALDRIGEEFGVPRSQCAFVGDAWNDISVLKHAGLGIAFRPKGDDVRAAADFVVEDGSLEQLLELFPGVPR